MEEEINYSTVVFKNGGPPPKEVREDPAIYSKVRPKEPATTAPNGEAAARSHVRVLATCLGILCFLLVVGISAIIWISALMIEQRVNLSNLSKETEELSRLAGNLNWTLGVILKFNSSPVNEYCPDRQCQPCLKDWILFQEKCYLFYNEPAPWKTWEESRTYCQDATADLVVIDSLHEQEFISNHTEYYFDNAHGYWFGLYKTDDKNWLWVDGLNDTLMFWKKEELGTHGPCALMIPGKNLTENWYQSDCAMQNKFICESEALIRST